MNVCPMSIFEGATSRLRSNERVGQVARSVIRLTRLLQSPFLGPRRFQAYGLGMVKSGTHSMAEIFKPHYRSAHEPEAADLIDLILEVDEGTRDPKDLAHYVRKVDKRWHLEFNSSQLNYYFIDLLVEEFPDAKFIHTWREPYSWLDSMINQQLARGCSESTKQHRDFRFGTRTGHPRQEKPLAELLGLYTLAGYWSYWSRHNQKILDSVPFERLLVIDTHEISAAIPRIAQFLDIPSGTLNVTASHAYKAKKHYHVLSTIDQNYLSETLEEHCGNLLAEFHTRRNLSLE